MTLSKQEIEAFDGLNDGYIEMERKLNKIAPTCHFRKMFFDECEGDRWREGSVCGHTKAR